MPGPVAFAYRRSPIGAARGIEPPATPVCRRRRQIGFADRVCGTVGGVFLSV
jgi:hypothetical protein